MDNLTGNIWDTGEESQQSGHYRTFIEISKSWRQMDDPEDFRSVICWNGLGMLSTANNQTPFSAFGCTWWRNVRGCYVALDSPLWTRSGLLQTLSRRARRALAPCCFSLMNFSPGYHGWFFFLPRSTAGVGVRHPFKIKYSISVFMPE